MFIATISKKGGVGKTTTTVNVAAALADLGFRTLVVDLDANAGASLSLGLTKKEHIDWARGQYCGGERFDFATSAPREDEDGDAGGAPDNGKASSAELSAESIAGNLRGTRGNDRVSVSRL